MKTLVRIGILAGIMATWFSNPYVAHAQNARNCGWPVTLSPDAFGNFLGPDNFARYYVMPFDAKHQTMTITGRYPHARYFSFVAYDGASPVDVAGHLYDSQITPDQGSGGGTYTVMFSRGASASGNVIHVGADFVWVLLRIYVPADHSESGLALTGGVPLPTVSLDDQRLEQCFPTNKLDDVRAMLESFFPPGFDLVGNEGTPATDQLWFATPTVPPLALLPNPDNKYIAMLPGDHYQPGRIIVIHGKAPGSADMRYWSLCNNDLALPVGVVQCTADLVTDLQGGDYTIVISDDLLRPDWLQQEITWLPYGDESYPKIVFFRNMLPSPNFSFAIQNVANSGKPGCTFEFNLPKIPDRGAVDAAGQCAQTIMKDYYPLAAWCDKSTFQAGGWQACIQRH